VKRPSASPGWDKESSLLGKGVKDSTGRVGKGGDFFEGSRAEGLPFPKGPLVSWGGKKTPKTGHIWREFSPRGPFSKNY